MLLLSDARFPAGGHAHSGGVEPAATAGTVTGIASLEVFLRGRLRTAGMVAAGLAAAACARAEDGRWDEFDAEAEARTPSPAQREASRRQGRALLRAARAAWPEAGCLADLAAPVVTPVQTVRPAAAPETGTVPASGYRGGPHHAVVLGAAAAAAGCTAAEAARIAAYQSVSGPASAAVRLLALDPMRAAAVLARLAGDVDATAERAAAYAEEPLADLPYPSAPALDLLAEAHIRAEVRLFES
ncbi:MAG TPA: urease accessory UreF family protein [Trebonia sp.]|nr:urease accessory UreF family protein [Trebonia sp.]